MDMIGTVNTPVPTVLLEGAELSQRLIDRLAEAAATYTSLVVQTSLHPFNSDHVPFIDASMPAVLTIEGADGANDNIHTGDDTMDRVDIDLALEIVRMNVATAASALGRMQGEEPD
jgi:Zn-dependent M28 family amino/carboxypeptidase